MAEYLELYIDKGSDFNTIIELKHNDDTNLPQNADGYIITSQLRRSLLSINATANLAGSVYDAPNGKIKLSLDAANTANLKSGNYFFDVKVKDRHNSNTISKLYEGMVYVIPGVTI